MGRASPSPNWLRVPAEGSVTGEASSAAPPAVPGVPTVPAAAAGSGVVLPGREGPGSGVCSSSAIHLPQSVGGQLDAPKVLQGPQPAAAKPLADHQLSTIVAATAP